MNKETTESLKSWHECWVEQWRLSNNNVAYCSLPLYYEVVFCSDMTFCMEFTNMCLRKHIYKASWHDARDLYVSANTWSLQKNHSNCLACFVLLFDWFKFFIAVTLTVVFLVSFYFFNTLLSGFVSNSETRQIYMLFISQMGALSTVTLCQLGSHVGPICHHFALDFIQPTHKSWNKQQQWQKP